MGFGERLRMWGLGAAIVLTLLPSAPVWAECGDGDVRGDPAACRDHPWRLSVGGEVAAVPRQGVRGQRQGPAPALGARLTVSRADLGLGLTLRLTQVDDREHRDGIEGALGAEYVFRTATVVRFGIGPRVEMVLAREHDPMAEKDFGWLGARFYLPVVMVQFLTDRGHGLSIEGAPTLTWLPRGGRPGVSIGASFVY